MSLKLKLIIIAVMLILLLYVFRKIKHDHLSMKYALIWIITDVLVILATIFVESLFKVASFLGIETVSNMMFFLGFVFLLIECFNLSHQLSIQNKKIISLTQKIGIEESEKNNE